MHASLLLVVLIVAQLSFQQRSFKIVFGFEKLLNQSICVG